MAYGMGSGLAGSGTVGQLAGQSVTAAAYTATSTTAANFVSSAGSAIAALSMGNDARVAWGGGAYLSADATGIYTAATIRPASGGGSSVGTANSPFSTFYLTAGAGGASTVYQPIGALSVNTSVVGTGADTTEDTLMSFSLPANCFSVNAKAIRVTAWGDGVSTADATTVRGYFGHATVLASGTNIITRILTASQVNTWEVVIEIFRTAAGAQISKARLTQGGTATFVGHSFTTPAGTETGAMLVGFTGQRAVSSVANSVRQLGMLIEFIN